MITMLWLYLTTNGIIMLSGVGGVKIFMLGVILSAVAAICERIRGKHK